MLSTPCRQISEEEQTMNITRTLVIATAALMPAACHSKKQQQENVFIPPGYYLTRAEVQDFAHRANADLARTRAKEKAEGVQAKDRPCGQYRLVSTRNSEGRVFWGARMDASGCSRKEALPHFLTPQTGGKKP
jgi:hypothetical protein